MEFDDDENGKEKPEAKTTNEIIFLSGVLVII
jgi:hypothetical protein